MPLALVDLTLKCKHPKVERGEIVPCGECPTGCRFNDFVAALLADGYTPAEVFDYGNNVRRRGPYHGIPGGDQSLQMFGLSPRIILGATHDD